jgi:hypothetical protein
MRIYDFRSGVTEDSVLLGCDAVSLSEQFPDISKDHSFLMFKMPQSSGPLKIKNYNVLKYWEVLTQ